MLHDLETLIGQRVIATDGDIGTVRNFLFDDQTWTIRHLVVDVRSWLNRRDVVLPITAMEQPDWVNKTVHVRLTKEQVRNSPDVDTEKPVSRQQETAMMEYWGKLAYWLYSQLPPMAPGTEYLVHSEGNLHLRSVWDLEGYEVCATDGEFGRLEGFILDEATWHIGYMDVKAGDWLESRSVLVPTRLARDISWADRKVNLYHTRAGI